jgi:hypothetical protein
MFVEKTRGCHEISPRTGRPTDNPKRSRLELRLSDDETLMLDYCVEKTGLSKAEIIRQGIKDAYEKYKKK